MNKIAFAKAKYVRISPRKMVGVCKLVRGKDLIVAKTILMQTAKKGARIIEKTLKSATANAKNKNMDEKRLFISKIAADMGPSIHRSLAWSRGTALPIKKRMTHLTIILEERPVVGKPKKQEAKIVDVAKKEAKPIVKEKKEKKPKVTVKKKETK